MIDAGGFKQTLKDASDDEAKSLYIWATACMEVRGLIDIAGAPATRKRRSDAGRARKNGDEPGIIRLQSSMGEAVIDLRKNAAQPSLSGLPDEDQTK